MLKAYNVYRSPSPENGCLLTFAHSRNEAKMLGVCDASWEVDYIEMRAIRVPAFDQYTDGDEPYYVVCNADLPPGAPSFYDESGVI